MWKNLNIVFLVLGEPQFAIKFSDNKVCKSFLVGCCPHSVLATTVSSYLPSPAIQPSSKCLLEVFIGNVRSSLFSWSKQTIPRVSLSFLPLITNYLNFITKNLQTAFPPSLATFRCSDIQALIIKARLDVLCLLRLSKMTCRPREMLRNYCK